ncbi:MAG: hypothetical protein HFJ48_03750 [Clostridia bacterium]|nr:hypothetical protein [Clostridia bacterium]
MKTSVEFKDNRIEIKQELSEKSLIWLEEVATEIEAQTVKNARRDTSNTARNWQHYVDTQKGEAYIGNPLENALWEELGTGEYAVNGDGRKTPWYVAVDTYTGKKKPTYNGKVEIVYIEGKAFYKTNGKKPVKALTKAFATTKSKAIKKAEEVFGGVGK